jgi:hypothetical protein
LRTLRQQTLQLHRLRLDGATVTVAFAFSAGLNQGGEAIAEAGIVVGHVVLSAQEWRGAAWPQ